MCLYFAYGSNMCQTQMSRRCPSSKLLGVAKLEKHALVFGGWSQQWQGGVASVVDSDRSVRGVLYHVSDEDMEELDRYEGYPTHYDRDEYLVSVFDDDAEREVPAWVYYKQEVELQEPSVRYFNRIYKAYVDNGIPIRPLLAASRGEF